MYANMEDYKRESSQINSKRWGQGNRCPYRRVTKQTTSKELMYLLQQINRIFMTAR